MTTKKTCFADDIQSELLDRQSFRFHHQLLGHPALSLENLGRMIPALPEWQVHYSSGKLQPSDDFGRAHMTHANGLSIEETIETIRTSDSYIMIREPNTDTSFHPLYQELIRDVQGVMQACGAGREAHDAKLYLFISSPNSVTPFHIDRYSNFLMQIQGSKEVSVFPQWDPRSVPCSVRESIVAYSGERATWHPDVEKLRTAYHVLPGEALHIPFVAGHHVRNGPEVSITLSLFFHTNRTRSLTRAMHFNDNLRRRLGLTPHPIGMAPVRDAVKSSAWLLGRTLAQALRRGS